LGTTDDPYEIGHQLDLRGPIALSRPNTKIRAIVFAEDPELGGGPFRQLVGITADEYVGMQRWDAKPVLHLLRQDNRLLITDLDRPSITDNPDIAATTDAGSARVGSSTPVIFVSQASRWAERASAKRSTDQVVIAFGASAAEPIARGLAGWLPFGRPLTVLGPQNAIGSRRLPGRPSGSGGVSPSMCPLPGRIWYGGNVQAAPGPAAGLRAGSRRPVPPRTPRPGSRSASPSGAARDQPARTRWW
jgi:hypothetical protein